MRSLFVVIFIASALLCGLIDPAAAQNQIRICVQAGTQCIPVSNANPLPTSSSGGGGSAVTVAAGADVTEGNTADAPCTVPTSATACTLDALLKAVANAINTATVTYPTVLGINFSGGGSSATASAIKSTGGQMLKVYCYNPNASVVYFQTFNTVSGSVTPGSTAPIGFYGIPPASAGGYSTPVGDNYTTAMSAAVTTTYNGGTQPTTAVPCTVSYN